MRKAKVNTILTPTPQVETVTFEVTVSNPPPKPVTISLEGPTTVKVTADLTDSQLLKFDLKPGEYQMLIRAEGCKNFQLPVKVPENQSVVAALTPLPPSAESLAKEEARRKESKEKQQQQERARLAEAQRVERARKAQVERERQERARKAEEQREAQRQAAAQKREQGAMAESMRLAEKMVRQRVAVMSSWPSDVDHASVLAVVADKLFEEGDRDDFSPYLDHLESTTTSRRREAAKLIVVARDLFEELAPNESMTLLETAKNLCVAAPAEGRPHDLVEVVAGALCLYIVANRGE